MLLLLRKKFQATPIWSPDVLAPRLPFDFRIGDVMRNSHAIRDHVAEPGLGDDALEQTRRSHTHGRRRRLARGGRQCRSDNTRDQEETDLLWRAPDGDSDPPTGT